MAGPQLAADQIQSGALGGASLTVAKLAQDVQSILVTQTPTGLQFPVAAGTAYEFDATIALTSAATGTGWTLGLTGPASPVFLTATQEYQSSATAWTTSTLQAFGNFPTVTSAYVAQPSRILARVRGLLVTGTAGGTVALTFATEIAASAVTVKRGSTLRVV